MKYSSEQIEAIIIKEATAYLVEKNLITESAWSQIAKNVKDAIPDSVTDTLA